MDRLGQRVTERANRALTRCDGPEMLLLSPRDEAGARGRLGHRKFPTSSPRGTFWEVRSTAQRDQEGAPELRHHHRDPGTIQGPLHRPRPPTAPGRHHLHHPRAGPGLALGRTQAHRTQRVGAAGTTPCPSCSKELIQFAGHSDIHVAMHYQEAVNDRERDSPNGWPRWACRTPARGDPSRWSLSLIHISEPTRPY